MSLNAAPPTAIPHYVGELYGGGVVIWVDCSLTAEHGLIAALVDQEPVGGATWAHAVTLCTNYHGGNFSDWRLPTLTELYRLGCKAHHVPGGVVNGLHETNNSNDHANYYWSSTGVDANHSYVSFMWNVANSGGATTNSALHNAINLYSVRAVRSF